MTASDAMLAVPRAAPKSMPLCGLPPGRLIEPNSLVTRSFARGACHAATACVVSSARAGDDASGASLHANCGCNSTLAPHRAGSSSAVTLAKPTTDRGCASRIRRMRSISCAGVSPSTAIWVFI